MASVPLDPGSAASEFYVPLVRGIYGSRGICALGSHDSEVNAIHAKLAVTTDSNAIHAKLMPFANLINDLVPGSGTHGSRQGVSCRLGCNRDPARNLPAPYFVVAGLLAFYECPGEEISANLYA